MLDNNELFSLLNDIQSDDRRKRHQVQQRIAENPTVFQDVRAIPLIIAVAQLRDSGLNVVVDILLAIGTPVIEPLIKALPNDPWGYLSTVLGQLKATSAVGSLFNALVMDRELELLKCRKYAALALVAIGDVRVVPPLTKVLINKKVDNHVRELSALVLGKLTDPRALAPLCTVLKDKENKITLRRETLKATALFRDRRVLGLLKEILEDGSEDASLRADVVPAFFQLGGVAHAETLFTLLNGYQRIEDARVLDQVIIALAETNDVRMIQPLINVIRTYRNTANSSGYRHVVVSAAVALSRFRHPLTVSSIVDALHFFYWKKRDSEGDYELIWYEDALILVRETFADMMSHSMKLLMSRAQSGEITSARILGEIGDAQVVSPLFWGLARKQTYTDERSVIQSALRKVLHREIQNGNSIESLRKSLSEAVKSSDRDVQKLASEWINKLNDKTNKLDSENAVARLVASLHETQPDIRRHAARKLGESKDPQAVIPLIVALKDSARDVRCEAARSLGKLRDTRAVEPLFTLIKIDKENEVQKAAILSLGEIGEQGVVPRLLEFLVQKQFRYHATGLVGQIMVELDPSIFSGILACLGNGHEINRGVIKLLGTLRDSRAAKVLIDVVGQTDDGDLKASIIHSLGQIGAPEATEVLLFALHDQNVWVRKAAAQALGNMKSEQVEGALELALHDPHLDVRQAARYSLHQLRS